MTRAISPTEGGVYNIHARVDHGKNVAVFRIVVGRRSANGSYDPNQEETNEDVRLGIIRSNPDDPDPDYELKFQEPFSAAISETDYHGTRVAKIQANKNILNSPTYPVFFSIPEYAPGYNEVYEHIAHAYNLGISGWRTESVAVSYTHSPEIVYPDDLSGPPLYWTVPYKPGSSEASQFMPLFPSWNSVPDSEIYTDPELAVGDVKRARLSKVRFIARDPSSGQFITLPKGAKRSFLAVEESGGNTKILKVVDLEIPPNGYCSEGIGLNDVSDEIFPQSTAKTIRLKSVMLYSDLNNDGKLDTEDERLSAVPYSNPDSGVAAGGTAIEQIEKGTEYLFFNDEISNGSWDREDSTAPPTTPDPADSTKQIPVGDDDAKEFFASHSITDGQVWFTHPAIAALSFYRDKQCTDKINELTAGAKMTLSSGTGGVYWPGKIFIRADIPISFDPVSLQFAGDLSLMVSTASTPTPTVAKKMKLTVLRGLGAESHHAAALDYILENNSYQMNRRVDVSDIEDTRSNYAVIIEERSSPVGINAFLNDYRSITMVTAAGSRWDDCAVVVNGTYAATPASVPMLGGTGYYDKHQGELYYGGTWDTSCSVVSTWSAAQFYCCSEIPSPKTVFGVGALNPATALNGTAGTPATRINRTVNWSAIGQAKLSRGAGLLLIGSGSANKLDIFHDALSQGAIAAEYRELDGGSSIALSVQMIDKKHKVRTAGV
ncbi:MAG: hypothetical protein NTV80_03190, partial [Verrucomicrobia bacterium]|nr:hypothetical protein [Verrucomicrobiota bacterium]